MKRFFFVLLAVASGGVSACNTPNVSVGDYTLIIVTQTAACVLSFLAANE